ncbi:MAG: SpoIIIAC/SpoIIIAD family protein, partial [Clostridia bacterium]
MDILQIAAVGIISALVIIILKQEKPELAPVLSIGAGIIILLMILDGLYEVVYAFYNLAEVTSLNEEIFKSILKIVGVGYVAEFSSAICNDSGNKSVGDKVML